MRGHPSEVQREEGKEAADRQYVNIAVDHMMRSKDKYSSFRYSMQGKYDLVRGYWKEMNQNADYGGSFNDVSVNFLFSMIQSDIAKKELVIFGERPYVQFVGSGQEDMAKARKRSALIERQADEAKLAVETTGLVCCGNYYGKAVYRSHWLREYGGYYTRERTFRGSRIVGKADPRTGMRGIRFDGPSGYMVDLQDWFPQPGIARLDKMTGVAEQSFPDWEEIVAGSERGPDGEEPLYDPDVVAKARYDGSAAARVETMLNARFDVASSRPDDPLADRMGKIDKPCHLLEYHGRVPRNLGMKDPETGEFCTNLRIVVLNMTHLLAVAPIPFWDRKPPYFDWGPLVDPHYYYPPGKIEIAERLQAGINKWVSRGFDLLDLYADPLWVFDENSGLDPEMLFTGPGNAIGVNGPVSEEMIRQLVPDMRGYQVTMDQVNRLWQWMQQVLGMSADISLGAGEVGSDRQSAHEFVGRERAIDLRQRLELLLFEENMLKPIFNHWVMMNRQWLPLPREIALIGSNALYDVVTGGMVPPTREFMDYGDLEGHLDTYPLGVTRQLSLQSRQNNIERVTPLLAPFMPALNMRAYVMQLLPLYGMPNVSELTNTQEEMAQAIQMGMMLEQGGGMMKGGGQSRLKRSAGAQPLS